MNEARLPRLQMNADGTLGGDLPLSLSTYRYPERLAHCRRVAHFCWQVTESIPLDLSHRRALLAAAIAHDSGWVAERDLGIVEVYKCVEDTGEITIDLADKILRCWQNAGEPGSTLEIETAARVLEVCDDFDAAVEFSAFDRTPICEAIRSFLTGAEGYDSSVVDALRAIVGSKSTLNHGGALPIQPSSMAKLMRTTAESTTVRDLERIAASDPVLAARLLSTANSVSFGSRHTVVQLSQAILRLGVPFARKTLIAASFGRLFASATLKQIWTHSQEVAAAAHELAGSMGFDQELAFVAGLLHEIGRLILIRCGTKGRQLEEEFACDAFPRVYTDALVYGFDHAAIGSDLLQDWGLPDEIVAAVEYQSRPEATDSVMAGILYLSEAYVGHEDRRSETLSAEMRRVAACRLTGVSVHQRQTTYREAPIFSLAV